MDEVELKLALPVDCRPPLDSGVQRVDTCVPMGDRERILKQTADVRDRAEDLLDGLLEAKSRIRSAPPLVGSSDPYAQVTGQSAIDRAINSTRKMVETLRRAFDDAASDLTEEDAHLLVEAEDAA